MGHNPFAIINLKFSGPGLAMAAILLCLPILTVSAGEQVVSGPFARRAHAPVDQVFESVTSGNNRQSVSADWQGGVPEGFQPMRSSSYPWATTTYGENELWLGTIAQG